MKKIIYKGLFLTFILLVFNNLAMNAQDIINLKVTSPAGIDWDIDAIKSQNDHGPQITENVSGELVRAFDAVTEATDNDTWTEFGAYCCDSIVNPSEIAGKIAYISRGACTFSGKIWRAEQAGAIGVIIANRAPIGLVTGTHNPGLIIMAGTPADGQDSITIPAVFISYEDRIELEQMMDAGTVNITFEAAAMYDATGPLAYSTPLDQVQPFQPQIVAYHRMTDTLINVEFICEITDPSSGSTIFTELVDTLLPGKDWNTGDIHDPIVEFTDQYTPTAVGTYTMTYSASTQAGTFDLDGTVITKTFEVTDYTYAYDNGVVEDGNGMQVNDASYLENGGVFDVGSYIYAGPAGGSATHASFAIANPGGLDVGLGFEFTVKLYKINTFGDNVPFDDVLPTTALDSVVYAIDGSEVPNQPIHVQFPTPIPLSADSIYLVYVESGGFNFTDQIPAYTTAGGFVAPNKGSVYRFGTTFNSSGFEYWNDGSATYPHGGRRPVVRLHMDGFVPMVSTELLPDDQYEIFPTLSSEQINVKFDLNQPTDNVFMIVTSANGRTMYTETHDFIQNQTLSVAVNNYPAGTYFLTVKTNEGVRTKKFVVAR